MPTAFGMADDPLAPYLSYHSHTHSLSTFKNVLQYNFTTQNCHLKIMQETAKPAAPSSDELQREVAALMVESLNLEISADQIAADALLFGEGLGLDSIDVLEVALVVSKRYGLQLRADSADNQRVFSSLRTLCDYIAAQRTR